MAVPPPLSTSTPLRPGTVVRTCSAETRHAQVRLSSSSHQCPVANGQPVRLTNGQRIQRTLSAGTRSDRQNHLGVDDKDCSCDDVCSTPTSSAQPGVSPGGSRLTFDVAETALYYRTMPSTDRRPPTGLDPAKYQLPALGEAPTSSALSAARRSSPSVFRFDAPHPLSDQRLYAQMDDVVDTEPSPIYAEPCDRLTDGLRHRVAMRRGRRLPTTESAHVVTPPISASYKLPLDFLQFATKRSTEQRAVAPGLEPSASLPDARNTARSPQIVVSPPSSVNVDDVASVSTVQTGPFLGRAEGRGSQSRSRMKVRAAAAAVRRQRRSNYDNVDDDVDEDQNDEDACRQASRCTTVSSAATDYSPPWDADRWRFLVDTADRQLRVCGDDVKCCDGGTQRTETSKQPEQVCSVVGNLAVLPVRSCSVFTRKL